MTDPLHGLSDHDRQQRDLVLDLRVAFIRGVLAHQLKQLAGTDDESLKESARLRYPMPRMTRPRIYTHHRMDYRVKDNILEYRWPGQEWKPADSAMDLYNGLKDLFAHPVEEVPDNG